MYHGFLHVRIGGDRLKDVFVEDARFNPQKSVPQVLIVTELADQGNIRRWFERQMDML